MVPYLDAQVFKAPQVILLPAAGDLPLRLVVVDGDLVLGQTGFSVIFADGRSLVPPIPAIDETLSAADLPAPEALEAAMIRASGFKPEADPEESDLFMAIAAACGFGAEDYLKLYPEGAYATEARAILAGPRLTLDALRYTEGSNLKISFQNLPPGSSASVEVAADYATVAGIYIPQALPWPRLALLSHPRVNRHPRPARCCSWTRPALRRARR